MSVRKRKWTSAKGERKEAWVADYVDQAGKRHLKTFAKKKEADTFASTTHVEVREGTHVADSASVTVERAGALWLARAEADGLERTTLDQYRQHLRLHINPFLGATLLSRLNTPTISAFEQRLRTEGRSPTLTRYVLRSLGSILADAQEQGLVVRNTVRERRKRRRRDKDAPRKARGGNLKIGVDIPTPVEIKQIVAALDGSPWQPLLLTAIFTGLRASELRGLRWSDVSFAKKQIHVQQRADRYQAIGAPKTVAGDRRVPLPPGLVNVLREWKLKCPPGDLGLVFPNAEGNVQWHTNIIQRGLIPVEIAAGVTVPVLNEHGKPTRDDEGRPIVTAKYTGLHALRHFYASWCINRTADGGLELPAKVVQHRLGHSSITVTLDTYGHLFPSSDDGAELANAERILLT
jgi:integrase